VPFSINTDFWSSSGNTKNKEGILFIGNDGNRDFKKVISIAKKMPELKFTFLTESIQQSVSLPKNVKLIKGHWNKSVLTDLEVKKLYEDSKISIIPLHDSLQPSGQSVAMQSMAMGVPVMISKTRGFWDTDNFLDGKNILLLENNSVENWVKTINEIYDNSDTLNLLALNANELVRTQYDMRKFYDKLKIILFVNNSV
jgi:glycosyltransferase involved in cell wall biosynthesis